MSETKVIVCGGRDFTPEPRHWEWLHEHMIALNADWVVSGGARGADAFGEAYAAKRCMPLLRIPADWNAHGRSAGPRRNEEMASIADACIAFPGGRGTAHMVSLAKRRGLPVVEWAA